MQHILPDQLRHTAHTEDQLAQAFDCDQHCSLGRRQLRLHMAPAFSDLQPKNTLIPRRKGICNGQVHLSLLQRIMYRFQTLHHINNTGHQKRIAHHRFFGYGQLKDQIIIVGQFQPQRLPCRYILL